MPVLVEVLFDANQDFYHTSCIYAGLDMLARRGLIRMRLRRPSQSECDILANSGVCILCINIWKSGASVPTRIAIDLQDQSNMFAMKALERCDGYMKRSYYTPDIRALPAECAVKVRPFGLNYACRTVGSTRRLLRSTAIPLLSCGVSGLRRLRSHMAWPKVTDFEQSPQEPLRSAIIFQTRVWEPDETAPGESEKINEGRVAIIRTLRETFGDRFVGGLVPTPLSLSRYPKEVTTLPTQRRQYTAISKQNLVAIYTVGLHKSTAFKLPECLAAGQCLVAEVPRNEILTPLVPGVHFLPFNTPDECVAACQRLLADAETATKMRLTNFEYYKAHVAPVALMYRVLGQYIDFAE